MLKQMGKLTYRRLSLALTIGLGLLTTAIKAPTTDQESIGLEDITSQERDPQAETLAKLETEMQTLNDSIARVEAMMQQTQTALQTLTQQSTQTGQAIATRMQTMRRPEASPSSTRIAIPPIPENLRGQSPEVIAKAASTLSKQGTAAGSDDENNPTPQKPLSLEQLARNKKKLRQLRLQRSSNSPTTSGVITNFRPNLSISLAPGNSDSDEPAGTPKTSPNSPPSSPQRRTSPRSPVSSDSSTPRGGARNQHGSKPSTAQAIQQGRRRVSFDNMDTHPPYVVRPQAVNLQHKPAVRSQFTDSDDTEADANSDDDTTSELPL